LAQSRGFAGSVLCPSAVGQPFSQGISLNERETILWQRLDLPGHEAAMAVRAADGWQLSGVAVLAESKRPCRVDYVIECDVQWLTRRCSLRGHIGAKPVELDVVRLGSGEWTVGGESVPDLDGCDDIDLGFSPSTNLLPIRRLDLAVGAKAAVRAAWIRFPNLTTEVLEQVYTRVGQDRYVYESAGGAFRRELTVSDFGFVLEYPGIWRAEARVGT
jgi:hypothetical protein